MATIGQTNVRMKNNPGIRFERVFDYTGPASYATGGDSLTANEISLGTVEFADFGIALDANGANPRLLAYDLTNSKVRWFVPNTGSEVANATDLSGYTVRCLLVGK